MKSIFILLKIKNGIPKTILILRLANKKFFLTKWDFGSLFLISNIVVTIANISKLV